MTLSELRTRVRTETGSHYTDANIDAALNEAQRVFGFLTLCLERTVFTELRGNFFHIAQQIPDWIVPLRLRLPALAASTTGAQPDTFQGNTTMPNQIATGGVAKAVKLRPSSLTQMWAADKRFTTRVTTIPKRYGCLGADLMFFDGTGPTQLIITYACMPQPMVADTDEPEIPDTDHRALICYAAPRLRLDAGGSVLRPSIEADLPQFLAVVKHRADHVRARSRAMQYDRVPAELRLPDLARQVKAK